MEMRYRTATISFCMDLTDPRAAVIPVAVFLAGDVGSIRMAALATRLNHPIRSQLDPMACEVIDLLPRLLHEQVDEVCRSNHESLAALFGALCDAFRNSLFMTGVSQELSLEIDDATNERALARSAAAGVQEVLTDAIYLASSEIDHLCPMGEDVLDQVSVETWPFRHALVGAGAGQMSASL